MLEGGQGVGGRCWGIDASVDVGDRYVCVLRKAFLQVWWMLSVPSVEARSDCQLGFLLSICGMGRDAFL